MLFINFKSSLRATGENATSLARRAGAAQKETKTPIILVPHDFDLLAVRDVWKGELWCQHADYSRGTGRNQVELVKEWPGKLAGTFLNHSDRRYDGWSLLARVVNECNEYELKSVVFAGTLDDIAKLVEAGVHPTYIAYEPPELIASGKASVARAKPEIIKKAVTACTKADIPLVVGAGVKDKDDVKKSIELGAVGVIVSSAIILAEDQEKMILELAKGFK